MAVLSIDTKTLTVALKGLTKTQKGAIIECLLSHYIGAETPGLDPLLQLRLDLILLEAESKTERRSKAAKQSHANRKYKKCSNASNASNATNTSNAAMQAMQQCTSDDSANQQVSDSIFQQDAEKREEEGDIEDINIININNLNNNNIYNNSVEESKDKIEVKEEEKEREELSLFSDPNPREEMKVGSKKLIDGKWMYKRAAGKFFIAPTLEEVTEYCKEKGYTFSPKEFIEYYESSDWHMSNGKPVKNWKQCCVTRNSVQSSWGTTPTKTRTDYSRMKAEEMQCNIVQHLNETEDGNLNF